MMKQFQGLAHIAVLTEDMNQTIAFYELLGGTCTEQASVRKPKGENKLAMIDMGGFWIEAIEPGDGTPVKALGGVMPHFAVEVADLPACGAKLQEMGITTFLTEQPVELPALFGGLRNWFFTGPSGEQIELIEHFSGK